MSGADVYVDEYNCDTAVVTVTRSGGSTGEVTVAYGTIGGGSTAAANTDYIPQAGTLTFPDGDAGTQSFGVPIFDTVNDYESTETVNLALGGPTNGATLGSLSIAQLNINDSTSAHNSSFQSVGILNGDTRPCHESPFANLWIGKIGGDPLGSWTSDDPEDDGNLTGGTGSFFGASSHKIHRMDAILNAPVFDASNLTGATLEFATDFLTLTGEAIADIDVSINGLKGPWTNVWTRSGDSLPGPSSQSVDISSIADGESEVSVRFHYYNAFQDGRWQVDSTRITGQSTTPVPGPGFVALLALGAAFAAGMAWHLRRHRVRL